MKILRKFKVKNSSFDPRKDIKIFLVKNKEGFYEWEYFTYSQYQEYKKTNKIIATTINHIKNRFSTLKDAMVFKKNNENLFNKL